MPPNKIAVVGAGTTGMPMAALMASAHPTDGSPPPRVVVVQRDSASSGRKVDAINAGRAPIQNDPQLARVVAESVAAGRLAATHDHAAASDADAVVVCVPTGRSGLAPEYDHLIHALEHVAQALRHRPVATRPLVVIESTLAPSTMHSVVEPLFARHGLMDGADVLLANSPSRAAPGDPLDRVANATRMVGGLHPEAPVHAAALYQRMPAGRVLAASSLAVEVASTLGNAARDVSLALAAEVARWCDRVDVDFLTLREQVNDLLGAPVSRDAPGGLPIPGIGVGGSSLPRDGFYLWWRALEAGVAARNSLVLAARAINEASPAATVRLARMELGSLNDRAVAVLGASHRADTGDTRNAPGLGLAALLRDSGANVIVHDPHVDPGNPGLAHQGLTGAFTNDLEAALDGRSVIFVATAHGDYRALPGRLVSAGAEVDGVVDGCGLFDVLSFQGSRTRLVGIGRGRQAPERRVVHGVAAMVRAVSRGLANELATLAGFLNGRYARDPFNRIDAGDVRRLVEACDPGVDIGEPGQVAAVEPVEGFASSLALLAVEGSRLPRVPRVLPETIPAGIWFGTGDAMVPDTATPWPLTPQAPG